MKTALIFQGGWQGHEPAPVAAVFKNMLEKNGYAVTVTDTLEALRDGEYVSSFDLLVPCWTMGEIPDECEKNVLKAVENGTGLAGCHGGMCDAFRNNTEWQFMTGGQWVSHPGGDGVNYTVDICSDNPIVAGIKSFKLCSEQYYMHVDPANEVLATTDFVLHNVNGADKTVTMPAVWTKYWGRGRVFYISAGHHADVFENSPEAALITERGMLWAGDGKASAV